MTTSHISPVTTDLLNCIAILIAALRNFEEAVGETYDDEGGDIAAIEREFHAGTLGIPDAAATAPQGDWYDGYREGFRDAKKINETFGVAQAKQEPPLSDLHAVVEIAARNEYAPQIGRVKAWLSSLPSTKCAWPNCDQPSEHDYCYSHCLADRGVAVPSPDRGGK